MAFLPELAGGRNMPQVYCRSVYRPAKSDPPAVQFSDDALRFSARSNSLLRLLVVVDSMEQAETAWAELTSLELESVSGGEVRAGEAVFLIHSPSLEIQQPDPSSTIPPESVYRIATGEEFKASDLCNNRPDPVGYDMYRIKRQVDGRKYVLVRPDKFIYAACHSGNELVSACERIPETLFGLSNARASLATKRQNSEGGRLLRK